MARKTIRIERSNGAVLCERCLVADRFWTRLRGLMGRKELARGEGLLIRPAGSIHTMFMRFAIDVVFLDREDVIVKVVPRVRPWRLASARGAKRTLELPEETAGNAGLEPGEQLLVVPGRPRSVAA
jgi:uncharacterized protein